VSDRSEIHLKNLGTGLLVDAILIDGVTRSEVEAAVRSWQPLIETKESQLAHDKAPRAMGTQHLHWDWLEKFEATSGLLASRWMGIELQNEIQGLMLLDTISGVTRLGDTGRPLVYVHYLASAPWNAAELTTTPKYGLVGRVFMAAAIQISRAEEFKGRIALHSLPQAESYYLDIVGMTDFGEDPSKENLKYFEMSTEQADRFMEGSI